MKRRIHKTVLSLRACKFFLGTLLLSVFALGCGTKRDKLADVKCYKRESDSLRLADIKMKFKDSIRIVDSLHKADSLNKAEKNNVPLHPCYQPPRKKQN
jgi:hypothetical protein